MSWAKRALPVAPLGALVLAAAASHVGGARAAVAVLGSVTAVAVAAVLSSFTEPPRWALSAAAGLLVAVLTAGLVLAWPTLEGGRGNDAAKTTSVPTSGAGRGTDLTQAQLAGASLRGADLTDAVLVGANLRGADLTNACLRGADLTGAHLEGARLDGANLTGATGVVVAQSSGAACRTTSR